MPPKKASSVNGKSLLVASSTSLRTRALASKVGHDRNGKARNDAPLTPFEGSQTWTSVVPAVQELVSSSIPSPGLSPRIGAIFCLPPEESSAFHPATAPAITGGLTVVRRINKNALVSLPADKVAFGVAPGSARGIPLRPHTKPRGAMETRGHPAAGQYGLFACTRIPPRTALAPYLGVVHTEDESREESEYDLRVWATAARSNPSAESGDGEEELERIPLGIDATHAGSIARFVNDYRGILVRPNVFFQDWAAPVAAEHREAFQRACPGEEAIVRGIGLFTGAHWIERDQELCVSYGKGFWHARIDG